jgi:Protein of Unknown function (DUF2784)
MSYRFLASLTVILHAAFIGFVVVGALLVLRWPRLAWVHIPCALWGGWIEFSGRICPLTPLENHFRRLAGESGYPGGFIEHYVLPLIYPAGLTRQIQLGIGAAVIAINLVAYTLLWRRFRRRTP